MVHDLERQPTEWYEAVSVRAVGLETCSGNPVERSLNESYDLLLLISS